jgi:predicted RNA binding protein YcfA (HicA-like mRNA interferase family)
VLQRNGFSLARSRDHEIWVRRNQAGEVVNRVPVSHGNAEIRTAGLFRAMLRQAGKTEAHFYEVLKG